MTEKDYRTMTFEQATIWVTDNCRFEDVRKRIRSRQVAWLLYTALQKLIEYCKKIENELKEYKEKYGELK